MIASRSSCLNPGNRCQMVLHKSSDPAFDRRFCALKMNESGKGAGKCSEMSAGYHVSAENHVAVEVINPAQHSWDGKE